MFIHPDCCRDYYPVGLCFPKFLSLTKQLACKASELNNAIMCALLVIYTEMADLTLTQCTFFT